MYLDTLALDYSTLPTYHTPKVDSVACWLVSGIIVSSIQYSTYRHSQQHHLIDINCGFYMKEWLFYVLGTT